MSILLLSGPICVGKSSVARRLIDQHGFTSLRTGAYLANQASKAGIPINRNTLQEIGDSLDIASDFKWVVDEVILPAIASHTHVKRWLLDAVRKDRQVKHIRRTYCGEVLHVYLDASDSLLESRYEARRASGDDYSADVPYTLAVSHPNEQAARQLRRIADIVVPIATKSPDEIALEILGHQ